MAFLQCEARLQDMDMAIRDHRLAIRSSIKQIDANDSQIQSLQSEMKALHSSQFAFWHKSDCFCAPEQNVRCAVMILQRVVGHKNA